MNALTSAQQSFNNFWKSPRPQRIATGVGNIIKKAKNVVNPITISGKRVINPVIPAQVKEVTKAVPNYIQSVVNNLAVKSAGPKYVNWTQDLATDFKKRGVIEGLQDLTNPIIQNPKIEPFMEPLISKTRLNVSHIQNQNAVSQVLRKLLGLPLTINTLQYPEGYKSLNFYNRLKTSPYGKIGQKLQSDSFKDLLDAWEQFKKGKK